MTADSTQPSQRASDADRERAAQVLHEAMGDGRLSMGELDYRLQQVYKSTTVGELVPVVADLVPAATSSAAPAAPGSWRSRIGATPGGGTMTAVLGSIDRDGDWVVPAQQTVTAVLAGGKLDLTQARFEANECTLQVICVMGGIDIIVPRGLTVRVTGVGVVGTFDSRASQVGDPDSPVLTISGLALFGAVEVKRARN